MQTPYRCLKGAGVLGAALLAQVAICADYPTTISSFSPLAYWRFNETATSPAAQAFADSSSIGTSIGYAAGPVTNFVPGIVGHAVRFGNGNNQGGHVSATVDVPWNATVNPGAPFTVEGWINQAEATTDTTGLAPFSSMSSYFFGAARSGWLFYVNNTGRVQF